MKNILITCGALLLTTGTAYASEASDKAAGIVCMEAGDFVKILGKLDKLKPGQTDTVGMTPVMRFTALDGGALPSRVYYRYKGKETPFHMNGDGIVTNFTDIKTMHKKGDMCMQDKTRLDKAEDEDGMNLSIDMDLSYHNSSGVFTLPELGDGLKDGRAHIKKIVPGPVSLLIPKFTHFSIEAKDETPVKISAYKGDTMLNGLTVLDFEGAQIVEYKQLKALGADSLHLSGGPYIMSPTPSPDELKNIEREDE